MTTIQEKYEAMYASMVIKEKWKSPIYRTARQIVANKDKYKEISVACGGNIPWQFIGVIHNRESGCRFDRHLHNGDPLTARTRLVPKGRPLKGKPPFTFLQSAVDALQMKGYHTITDWSMGNQCNLLEIYNGLGYRNKGVSNPYLWSGSQHYTKGKYIRDHVYSASVVDVQMGVMPLLKAIYDVDSDHTDVKAAEKTSRRMKFTKRMDNFLQYLGLTTAGMVSFFQEARNFVTDHAGIMLLGLGVISWLGFKYIRYRSHEEVKEGRYKSSGGRK